MKKNIISILTILILVTVALPQVNAQARSFTPSAERKTETQNQLIANLKNRADQEINRRIMSLNGLIARINSIKRLSAANKTSLTSQIQSQITFLTTLRAKIDSDTDLATLRTDVRSIVNSYRIYLLCIPKIHILSASDILLDTADQFTTLAGKLETRIRQAKAAGKDVTSLEATLTDMKNKVNDAKTQAQNAENAVLPLTPDGYPANKTVLQSARVMLRTSHQDLVAARKDARTIIQEIKQMKITENDKTATPSSEHTSSIRKIINQ